MVKGIKLTPEEIQDAFQEEPMRHLYPPVLNVKQAASLLGLSVKTVYQWMSQGRLDGCYRKRGKHNLVWRDRLLALVFNGPKWR